MVNDNLSKIKKARFPKETRRRGFSNKFEKLKLETRAKLNLENLAS